MALKKQYTLNVWPEGNVRTLGKTILTSFPRDHTLSAFFYIYTFPKTIIWPKYVVVFGAWETTAQFYPVRNTFKFD